MPELVKPEARGVWSFPLLCGFLATGGQVFLFREFLIFAGGNELTTGYFFAVWLLSSAAGTWVGGRLGAQSRGGEARLLATVLLLAILALPICVLALGPLHALLGLQTGELVSPAKMLLAAALVLAPANLLLGLAFGVSYAWYSGRGAGTSQGLAWTYLLDCCGALAAGVLVSLGLVLLCGNLLGMCLLCLAANLALLLAVLGDRRGASAWKAAFAESAALCALGLATAAVFHRPLLAWSAARAMPGYEFRDSRDSPYGNLTVWERQGQRSLLYDGVHLPGQDLVQADEEFVHTVLLERALPRRVLLCGGACGGILGALLQYPSMRIDVVEQDPLLLAEARRTWLSAAVPPSQALRVTFIQGDARQYLSRMAARFRSRRDVNWYDAVFLALPDPATIQLNRFYTTGCFADVRDCLAPDGRLALRVTGDDAFLAAPMKRYLSTLDATLHAVFPQVQLRPGFAFIFVGEKDAREPLPAPGAVAARARTLGIAPLMASLYALRTEPVRLAEFTAEIRGVQPVSVNTDARPVLPWQYLQTWRQNFSLASIDPDPRRVRRWSVAGWLLVLAAGAAWTWRLGRRPGLGQLPLIAQSGFSGMAFTILLLLLLQSVSGALYLACGLLLALFMAGLSLGGWLQVRQGPRASPRRWVAATLAVAVCWAVIAGLAGFLEPLQRAAAALPAGLVLPVFWMLALVAGMAVGSQFLACCASAESDAGGRAGGRSLGLYIVDLLGGCAAALLVGPVLVPSMGMAATAGMLLLVNLAWGGCLAARRA